MNKNNETIVAVCATCLSFHKQHESNPVTEDIKEILRCLLHGFDIDAFFQLKPPDKQLKLCEKCHNTIRDMISVKERALNSFKELMKYWSGDTQKIPRYTENSSSSSHTQTGALLQIKQETEHVIDIKEEPDIIDEDNEPHNLNGKLLIELEPLIPLKREQEQAIENDILTNELINRNDTPALHSAVGHRNNLVINKVTASNVSQQNSYHNAATKLHNLKHTNSFVINKVTSTSTSENSSNTKFVKHITESPNSSIRITDIRNANNTAIANTDYLTHIIFETNNDNLFKRISVDDGEPLAQKIRKKPKILKTGNKGKMKNVGEAMIKPSTEFTKVTSRTKQQPVVVTTGATTSSIPDPITTQTEYERGIPESDSSATESEEEFKQHKPSNKNVQNKWYIKIVTREEILKKMEERRSEPEFVNAPYKCDSCVIMFPAEYLVEVHKKNVHAEDCEFTCFACQATFQTLITMNNHYYEHLTDICMYYCSTCDFETKHGELMQDHFCPNAGCKPKPPKNPKTMKLTPFKSLHYCPKCEFMTTRGWSLIAHYDKLHKDLPREKCEECGKFYKNKFALKMHIANLHTGKQKPAQDPSYCAKCDKWYTTKYSFRTHVKQKHTSNGRKFKCEVCDKELLTKKSVRDHEEFHAAVKAGAKNHICSTCSKAYYTERLLQKHVRTSHEKKLIRDHVCEVCGKGFLTSRTLKEHSAMHSDDRPLKCSFCEDTFKYKGALFTHVKLKHKKKKNGEESNEKKTKDSSKGKGQMKKTKRRKSVESSSTEEELFDSSGSFTYC